jgi:hypothetical protein
VEALPKMIELVGQRVGIDNPLVDGSVLAEKYLVTICKALPY